MTFIRACLAIVALTLVSVTLIPLQLLAKAFGSKSLLARLPLLWHRAAVRIAGIRVHQHNALTTDRPLLLVANHVSWLDITVLGSITELSFIAKSDVASWPVFGLFAKLQRSIFVDRQRRSKTMDATNEIRDRLRDGDVLVLFGEGTSSNGVHVLPFRTALIGAVTKLATEGDGECFIQPVAINYTQIHGLPIGRFHKPRIAWYGDMDLAPHLWWVLRHGEIDVDVVFGEPIALHGGADRKAVARAAETQVRQFVGELTAGRLTREAA